jgi:hypothetical protein
MALDVLLGLVQIGFIVWGFVVSIKPIAPQQRKWHIGGFIALGLVGILLTGLIAHRGSEAQEAAAHAQRKIQSELDATRAELRAGRLSEEYMKGQLNSLSVMVHSAGTSGQLDSEQLSAYLSQMSSVPELSDLSNAQLRDRTKDLVKRMKNFETRYDKDIQDDEPIMGTFKPGEEEKIQAEADKLNKQESDEFRAIFMDEANLIRLELLRRLHKADLPSREPSAFIGQLDSPDAISDAADYLEMLAKQLPR